MIRVRLIRPEVWARAPLSFSAIPPHLRALTERVIQETVTDIKAQLVAAIKGDSSELQLRFRALSPRYAATKGAGGPLRQTEAYVNAITVLEGPSGGVVGLPNAMHGTSALPLRTLARFLEYGTARMSPLPHWGPAAAWGTKRLRERLKVAAGRAIRIS